MRRRALCMGFLAFLTGLTGPTGPVGSAPGDLEELMHRLAQRKHGEASFVEQHFIALLSRPVESYGEMIYDAPDRLEKRTLEPRKEILLLQGDSLTIRRGGRVRVLDVKAYPQIQPLVEGMRATLAGDLDALAQLYEIDFDGDLARWTLTLMPRREDVAKMVARVRIEGFGDRLSRVEVRAVDGDRSLLTLRDHPTP